MGGGGAVTMLKFMHVLKRILYVKIRRYEKSKFDRVRLIMARTSLINPLTPVPAVT